MERIGNHHLDRQTPNIMNCLCYTRAHSSRASVAHRDRVLAAYGSGDVRQHKLPCQSGTAACWQPALRSGHVTTSAAGRSRRSGRAHHVERILADTSTARSRARLRPPVGASFSSSFSLLSLACISLLYRLCLVSSSAQSAAPRCANKEDSSTAKSQGTYISFLVVIFADALTPGSKST